jgi:hypothetical protein
MLKRKETMYLKHMIIMIHYHKTILLFRKSKINPQNLHYKKFLRKVETRLRQKQQLQIRQIYYKIIMMMRFLHNFI